MTSNANFVGNEHNNIVVLPKDYNETTLQCLHKGYESYGSYTEVAHVELEPSDLLNLIDVLARRYNDLSDYARDGVRLELKRIIEEVKPSVDDIPF